MKGTSHLQRFILFLLAVGIAVPAVAGEPTEQIKETTDKIISILTDPELKDSTKSEEKRKLIRQAVDERFDWEELARRSLARHWSNRTDEEKREFISLFSDLLEKTYMDKVDSYSGETVFYVGETVDGNYGVVNIKIVTERDTEIPAEYKVKKKEDGWFIYDISVNGVSLVNNYRTQFNSIILKSSYEDLVDRLKAKVAQR
ncbi:MAG: ABC transporter substrate-binding protein [candidate division Zixibacteria bacterium]|nr:ABC transporter substrate-binding protein [candidate division Zixibacteria bacterium]